MLIRDFLVGRYSAAHDLYEPILSQSSKHRHHLEHCGLQCPYALDQSHWRLLRVGLREQVKLIEIGLVKGFLDKSANQISVKFNNSAAYLRHTNL